MTNDRETENRGEPFENDAKSDFASAAEDAKSQSGSPDKKKKRDKTHLGHRKRLRLKAAEIGFEFLEEHEQLEMILFSVEKVKNTNEIAHDLLDTFGSLGNVLRASKEELMTVWGVGPAMADFITWLPSYVGLIERAMMEKNKRIKIKTEQDAIAYARTLFYDKNVENVYMISLTASGGVCGVSKLSAGIRNSADVTMHKIVAAAIRYGAYEVILSHNHPSGESTPSLEDIKMTKMVRDGLAQLGIRLKMHVIVTDGQCEIINDARLGMPF